MCLALGAPRVLCYDMHMHLQQPFIIARMPYCQCTASCWDLGCYQVDLTMPNHDLPYK